MRSRPTDSLAGDAWNFAVATNEYDAKRHAADWRAGSGYARRERQVLPLMRPLSGHPCESNEIQHEGGCVGTLELNWATEATREFQVQDYIQAGEYRVYVLVDSDDLADAAQARLAAEEFASTLSMSTMSLALMVTWGPWTTMLMEPSLSLSLILQVPGVGAGVLGFLTIETCCRLRCGCHG